MMENMAPPNEDKPGKKRKTDEAQDEAPVATKGKFQKSIQNSFGFKNSSDVSSASNITDLLTSEYKVFLDVA